MERIEAIIRSERLNIVKDALVVAGLVGLKVTPVTGRGIQRGVQVGGPSGVGSHAVDVLPKVRLEMVQVNRLLRWPGLGIQTGCPDPPGPGEMTEEYSICES